jgi:glycosyltransferase involved in cell wall biosynthesis
MTDMKKDPLVTVIIPAYNMSGVILNAIDSVKNQTYKNIELIIIDDGSYGNTSEVVSGYTSNNVQLYRQNNGGVSAARNKGISLSNGELIAFLDADDLWHPEKIRLQIEVQADEPDVGMIACGYSVKDIESDSLLQTVVRSDKCCGNDISNCLSFYQIVPASASGVLIKADVLKESGGFDETLQIAEDWDLWLRIAKVSKIKFVEQDLVVLRISGNKPNYRNLYNEEKSVLHVINKSVSPDKHRKAKAALYGYLGMSWLSAGHNINAFTSLIKSLSYFPFRIVPKKITTACNIADVDRYYLLFLTSMPISVRNSLKKLIVDNLAKLGIKKS